MTDQSTIDRLRVMKLTKMEENYLLRLALMVEAEFRSRINNRRARYRKQAQLEQL